MKEKSFKFRENFSKAIAPMTDKQAGKLIKALCNYSFDSKPIVTNDCAIKSAFTLIKTSLEKDEMDRENGRKGGIISAEKSRVNCSYKSNFMLIKAAFKPLEKNKETEYNSKTNGAENSGETEDDNSLAERLARLKSLKETIEMLTKLYSE